MCLDKYAWLLAFLGTHRHMYVHTVDKMDDNISRLPSVYLRHSYNDMNHW